MLRHLQACDTVARCELKTYAPQSQRIDKNASSVVVRGGSLAQPARGVNSERSIPSLICSSWEQTPW